MLQPYTLALSFWNANGVDFTDFIIVLQAPIL